MEILNTESEILNTESEAVQKKRVPLESITIKNENIKGTEIRY